MGKPRMIILVRHAQSEGNKNRDIHQTIPDHRVKLTPEGHRQALEAGSRLRDLLRPDDTIHFFTSPYRRTRETTEGILQSLTADSPSPSPFPRHTIKVYEEPRLREQDFGNFQPCSAEMERMWLERADYGHFFYRIPNGESAADAYDRVSGFNESLWRLFGEQDFANVCVLVTHGLMTRVFLMKWYHWSVEYFEDLRNINHCEFVIMKLNEDNGKYVLQNQLRTWSELRREKEIERQRDRAIKTIGPTHSVSSDAPVPIRRRWGGCPDGCNHGIRRKTSLRSIRTHAHATDNSRHDPNAQHKQIHGGIQNQERKTAQQASSSSSPTPLEEMANLSRGQLLTAPEPALGDLSKDEKPLERTIPSPTPHYPFPGLNANVIPSGSEQNVQTDENANANQKIGCYTNPELSTISTLPTRASPIPQRPDLVGFHRDSEDHLLHPPGSNYGLIHLVGRDGGGTLSGANSLAPSEDEGEHREHEEVRLMSTNRRGFHQVRPSQDLDNDGDDEGSGKQTPKVRRTRSHNHHRHTHTHFPTAGRRNITKNTPTNIPPDSTDGPIEKSPIAGSDQDHECEAEHSGDDYDALEEERREDQSIRGSVY